MEVTKSQPLERYYFRGLAAFISFGFAGMIFFAVQYTQQFWTIISNSMLVSGASLLSGALLGLIFGLPASSKLRETENTSVIQNRPKYRYERTILSANSNLTQISDWLSKILIALGVTQTPYLPQRLEQMSNYFAPIFGKGPFAIGVLVYFLVAGFMSGFLGTRFYFIRKAEETMGGFRRSDVKKDISISFAREIALLPSSYNMTSLSTFAEQYVHLEDHHGRYSNTGTGRHVYEIIQSEQHLEPLLATIFWQIIMKEGRFLENIIPPFVNTANSASFEYIVTCHGWGQYSLVVLVPAETDFTVISDTSRLYKPGLFTAYETWRADIARFIESSTQNRDYINLLNAIGPEFANEIIFSLNSKVLVTRKPLMVPQQLTLPAIPSPPHGVRYQNLTSPNSTLGLYAENKYGEKGFIMCLQSLAENTDDALRFIQNGQRTVTVNNLKGIIKSFDPVSDSCFVVLDNQYLADDGTFQQANILKGKTPRQENAWFEGFKSGPLSTYINGWSPDLPFIKPYNQLKIYTDPITNPGDSGSALKNSDGQICGFAFMRSGINEKPQLSSWIWAESVFSYHQLKY